MSDNKLKTIAHIPFNYLCKELFYHKICSFLHNLNLVKTFISCKTFIILEFHCIHTVQFVENYKLHSSLT
jgi:hypothetical protein